MLFDELKERFSKLNISNEELSTRLNVPISEIQKLLDSEKLLLELFKIGFKKEDDFEYSLDEIRELKNYTTSELVDEILRRERKDGNTWRSKERFR